MTEEKSKKVIRDLKKSTDEHFTPPKVYKVVRDYVCDKYGFDVSSCVRPFWPDTDYKAYYYPNNCLVLDNPPFSILSEIVKYYNKRNINYFLFAPHLTLFACINANNIVTGSVISYDKGKNVKTSFVTNLGKSKIEGDPKLAKLVADAANDVPKAKTLPKYDYPVEVVTSAILGKYVKKGLSFKFDSNEICRVGTLDAQKTAKKAIFGGGYFLSREATERHRELIKAYEEALKVDKVKKEENKEIIKWVLSERERRIVKCLGARNKENILN